MQRHTGGRSPVKNSSPTWTGELGADLFCGDGSHHHVERAASILVVQEV